jgi:hypothetical protein
MSEVTIEERLAEALAWASLGLGVGLAAAPGRAGRLVGIDDEEASRRWLRVVGLRELSAFALIKATQPRPGAAVWTRVAGDAKDLALLGLALRHRRASTPRLLAATAGVAAIAALDLFTALRLNGVGNGQEPLVDGRKPPPDDLQEDPAYEPPEALKGIKGG